MEKREKISNLKYNKNASNYKDFRLDGYRVTSSAPVAVFCGNVYGKFGSASGKSHLVSQVPPVARLGTAHLVPPLPNGGQYSATEAYQIRIVSSQDNNNGESDFAQISFFSM